MKLSIVEKNDEEVVESMDPGDSKVGESSSQSSSVPKKPRVLLAACGSVAAVKFGHLCHCFSEWAEVKAVATDPALHFINRNSLPRNVDLYTEQFEWFTWRRLGDDIVHIELHKWADILVIAPISANTLAKIAGGVSDSLLTCIVRSWDYSKPIFIAPSMNPNMWANPFTERHLMEVDELGIALIPPVTATRAMAEPSHICSTIQLYYQQHI